MPIPTLREALAADTHACFQREMRGSLRQGTTKVEVLVQDSADTAVNAFGGGDPVGIQNVVLLVRDKGSLDLSENEMVYISIDGTPAKEQKKIIVSTILSPDEVAFNITTRDA